MTSSRGQAKDFLKIVEVGLSQTSRREVQIEIVTFKLPVIMLEIISGRMTSFSIRIRISPGKPKYCLSRLERDAYSLTKTPKLIPGRKKELNHINFLLSVKDKKVSVLKSQTDSCDACICTVWTINN